MTGNLNFGDNDKAVFGAGSDLQIYSDGTTSHIRENNASGSLSIRGSLLSLRNPDDTKYYMRNEDGGSSTIYYDGSPKLATTSTGVDVTGTVTADGLDIDTTFATAYFRTNTTNTNYRLANGGDGSFSIAETNDLAFVGQRFLIADGGDISFYEDTGTTAKFFWDASAERLGIGTSSPQQPLEIAGTTPTIRLNDTRTISWTGGEELGGIEFYTSDTSANGPLLGASITALSNVGSTLPDHNLVFSTAPHNDNTGPVERMRIDSSGNVGIGTSSPSEKLDIVDSTSNITNIRVANPDVGVRLSAYTDSHAEIRVETNHDLLFKTNGNNERMRIASSGNVGIGTSNPTYPLTVDTGAGTLSVRAKGGSSVTLASDSSMAYFGSTHEFSDAAGTTERMRIDSSGNLLVGTTDTLPENNNAGSSADNGFVVGSGYSSTARYNAPSLYLNRTGLDGDIVTFRKDGSTVGSVSVTSSGTTYNTTSDARLKDNIETITDGTEKLMAMNPVTHTWIADPEAPAVVGFIAQEMQEVVPEAVSGEPDGEEMMSMDYGRITPVLVAALQDAHRKIEQLEARLEEMENN
jgi:hypothetical protein